MTAGRKEHEVRSLRRALIALGAIGAVAGAVPLALALAEEGGHQRWLIAITGPVIGWAFIGTGIVGSRRSPPLSPLRAWV
jgi:hypothetical protein